MSLNACGIDPAVSVSSQRRELLPHGTLEFPCAGYAERYDTAPNRSLPWHWHDDLEIIYVQSGELTIEIPGCQYHLTAGDCIAFNAGVLHSAHTDTACEIRSAVFSPILITGGKETVFARKYLSPLTGCSAFRARVFDHTNEAGAIQQFVRACGALADEPPGYEFQVRACLSEVCLALCRHFAPAFQTEGLAQLRQDEARVQQMLTYIHSNFSHPITLADIACAAGIGQRECLRCFRKTIHIPPMQYLLKYRMMQGADALLTRPADSIAQIAAGCGFDSPSNFSQQFRRFYGCTPRAYRARALPAR